MSLNNGWWDRPHTRHDRLQNDAIEQLRHSVFAQSSSARRQAERNRKATNRVAADLTRLEERLEDLVELTDLRFRLLDHHETNRVRNELNRRLSVLSRGGAVPTEPLDDIPGYWLPPAANLILATFSGNLDADVSHQLEIARERDRVRTDLFVLAAGVGFEVGELSQRVVIGLLNQPVHPEVVTDELGMDTVINHTWRQLWTDTASGGFGDQAREVLQKRLEAAVSDLDLADSLSSALSRENTNALTDLRRLRERCQKIMATVNSPATGSPDTDAWRDTLRGLVNEGHADEVELRDRTDRLLQRLGGDSDDAAVGMWSEAGTVKTLLVNDILDDSVGEAQAAVAMLSAADAVMLCAQRLWDRTHTDVPDHRTVRVEGIDVEVTANGPKESDRQEIVRRINAKYVVGGNDVRNWGLAVAGLVVLAVVFFVTAIPVLGGFALLGALGCLPQLVRVYREPQKVEELRQMQMIAAEKRLERAQSELVKLGKSMSGTSHEAAGERDAIQQLLGPYSRRR